MYQLHHKYSLSSVGDDVTVGLVPFIYCVD